MKAQISHIFYPPQRMPTGALAVNRWLLCGPFEQPMRFTPVTLEGEVNTWLLEGFSIHENPCRTEYVQERKAKVPRYSFGERVPAAGEVREEEGQRRAWRLSMPWGNPRVELSGFWYVPTRLVTYAVTELHVKESRTWKMTLRTCGAATLWVNGELAVDFVPYTRNREQQMTFSVDLRPGPNRFEIRFEDLAERDTQYYFRLDAEEDEEFTIALPSGGVEPQRLLALEQALEAAYIENENAIDQDVVLQIENPLGQDIPVSMRWGNFLDGEQQKALVFPAGAKRLVLGDGEELGMGYKYIHLQFSLGPVVLERSFGVETHLTRYDLPDAGQRSVSERKRAALRCIAEQGSRNIHTAAAILHTGGSQAEAERILREGIARINAREDCSDFYLVGLFRLWKDFYGTDLMEPSLWEEIRRCAVGFRYWIDEPGDDVMWFFSENHALLFHVCELLAGQLFPGERFSNGETGAEHRRKAEERLTLWFERFFREGLAEWNSNAYIPIDALGLLHLYDLAESEALKQSAKQALDLLFYYIVVHAHEGRLMATYGRSYEKELKGHYSAGTTSMCWIAYGAGNLNAHSLSNVIFCLSDYEPPETYRELLHPDGSGFTFRYQQGAGGYAKLYLYKTKDFVLSSIADFRPGKGGYQEHVMHYAASPEAQIWVNHPGELHSYGSGRPSFWAGNGILPKVGQYRGLAVLLYRLDKKHDADFVHVFLPVDVFDEWRQEGAWVLVRKGEAYAALWCSNGFAMVEHGANRRREWRAWGREQIWMLRASNRTIIGSFERFAELVTGSFKIETGPDLAVKVQDPQYGSITFGWEQPLMADGKEVSFEGTGVNGCLEKCTIGKGDMPNANRIV